MKFKAIVISLVAGLFFAPSLYAADGQQAPQDKGSRQQQGGMQNGGSQGGMQNGGAAEAPVTEVVILEIQQKLDDQGFDVGKPTGKIDAKTEQGLRDFQKSKGLPQTGQPDKQTQAALGVNGSSGKGGSPSDPSQQPQQPQAP
jgi:peptidoglycan hydrolase-like protein with peptidoglycan-binding domain